MIERRPVVQLGKQHIAAITCEIKRRLLLRMVEFGGGFSTALWLDHMDIDDQLLCVEHDPEWAYRITDLCRNKSPTARIVVAETFAEFVSAPANAGWETIDVLFVDSVGAIGGRGDLRRDVLLANVERMSPGGIAFLHDAEHHYARNKAEIEKLWNTEELLIDSDLWNRPVGLWVGTPRC